MSEEFSIVREDGPAAGRYAIYLPDGSVAEMTYRHTAPDVIAIDHTGVPDAWRNRGLAMLLVNAGIDDARAEGKRVAPFCSYVAAQFRRHPDWAPLLA